MSIRQRFNVWTLTEGLGPPFWETFNKILIRQRLNVWTLTEGLGPPSGKPLNKMLIWQRFNVWTLTKGLGYPFVIFFSKRSSENVSTLGPSRGVQGYTVQ